MKLNLSAPLILPLLLGLAVTDSAIAKAPKIEQSKANTAPPTDPKPVVRYDAFKDSTLVSTPYIQLGASYGLVMLNAAYIYDGKTPVKTQEVMLRVNGLGHTGLWWRDANEAYFIYGNTRNKFDAAYEVTREGAGTIESVSIFVPTDTFLEMVKQSKIDFQIAGRAYTVQGGYLTPLVELAKTIPNEGHSATNTPESATSNSEVQVHSELDQEQILSMRRLVDRLTLPQLRHLHVMIAQRMRAMGADTNESTDKASSGPINAAQFTRLVEGMTYDEVVKILGRDGVEKSRFGGSGLRSVSYEWRNHNGTLVSVTFQNDRLQSKYQVGLR